MNAQEKLSALRATLEPMARAWLEEASGQMGPMAGMAVAFLTPQVEGFVDRYVSRTPEELEGDLVRLIDFASRLRSDDARALVCHPGGGAHYLAAAGYEADVTGDPVRTADLPGGQDPVGQVAPGAGALPLGGGAAADR